MGTRGELRIYLGAAPGVGKTYAMLGEAHRRAERGTDVVVGLVETHGRAKTAELIEGLEVVPRRTASYRGVELTELDVDAVLARAPQVVLVDELAHTNAPGSRHAKRWQDVEELLDAGITVLTTVNVQHLESLNDVVERITGVRQQETVPDEVVRRAEQVELVDITPEALRRRLAHGNVYAAGAGRRRAGQLLPAAQPHRAARAGAAVARRPGRGRLAALPHRPADHRHLGDPGTGRRRADRRTGERDGAAPRRRIAERSGSAELFAVHVLRGDGLAGAPVGAVAGLRRLAEDVGASFHTVVGDDVPTALLDFARGVNADPARARHLAAVPARPGARRGHRGAGRAGLRAHRRAHGHPRRSGPRAPAAPPAQRGPGHPPGRRVGAEPACCRSPPPGSGSSAAASSGSRPTSCCSSSPP